MAQQVKALLASGGDAGDKEFNPWVEKILRGGNAAHSRILAWGNPWTEELGGFIVQGVAKCWT